jgi:hypothetical protein
MWSSSPEKTTTLNPGAISVRTSQIAQYQVIRPEGQLAGTVPIGLSEGQVVDLRIE